MTSDDPTTTDESMTVNESMTSDPSAEPTITPETTVGQLVAQQPSRSRVFEHLGIDYCCSGGRTLAEACEKQDLDVKTAIRMLEAGADQTEANKRDWTSAPLGDLIDHIESTHHAFLRRELPRLDEHLEKVCRVHGDDKPWLHDVREVFNHLRPHLLRHTEKEETIVFPYIRQLLGEDVEADTLALGGQPMKMMEREHDDAGEALQHIRDLTDDYTIPEGACATLRATIDGLRELEEDTHRHVHKENHILFERARSLESEEVA
jgi:regulator of cell morphogenesis and NO signaling